MGMKGTIPLSWDERQRMREQWVSGEHPFEHWTAGKTIPFWLSNKRSAGQPLSSVIRTGNDLLETLSANALNGHMISHRRKK